MRKWLHAQFGFVNHLAPTVFFIWVQREKCPIKAHLPYWGSEPNWLIISNGHLYLSGAWLGVHLRSDTNRYDVFKREWTMLGTVLVSIVNKIGGHIRSLDKKENLHFDNE
jgi:hypothetical protein